MKVLKEGEADRIIWTAFQHGTSLLWWMKMTCPKCEHEAPTLNDDCWCSCHGEIDDRT